MTRSLLGAVARAALPFGRALALALLVMVTPAAAAPAPAPAQPAPSVSVDELERLIGTLQDDARRARLVEQLRAVIAAQRGAEAEDSGDPVTLLGRLSSRLDSITEELLAAATVVVDLPRLFQWVGQQLGDEAARDRWLEAALKLGVIFGFALFGEWAVRALLARPRARLAAKPDDPLAVRLALLVVRAGFEALPIVAFALIAYSILPWTQPRYATSRLATTFIDANVLARVIVAIARTFLLPGNLPVFLGMGEETRTYLAIWIKRFTTVIVYGYALAEGAWWFGVPGGIYAIILKTTALVATVLGIVFILQNRAAVSAWLRGRDPVPGAARRRAGWAAVRQRLADTWHAFAIVYLVGIFLVYALHIEGGFLYLVRATLVTVVVIVAARIVVGVARRASQRGFAISPELRAKFPTLETRANRYLPMLTAGVSIVVYLFAGLTILQAWNIEAFAWFGSSFGKRVTSGLVSIGTVLLVALVVWEIFSSAIERYLAAVDPEGRPLPRSARARTLLPLLRTAASVLLVVMVTLIVLSEIGVNIAPLLAGAGVVGVAIGFGSQALVKDVITGLFMLIEDTLAVGDVVDVGKGHSGVVESITVRTIRLRDTSGTLHTIPFSEVSTVNNMTRDFAYFVANVAVSYREDPDRVIAVMREIGEAMYADAEWRPFLAAPLEIFGVDKLTETGIIVMARLKTLPLKQWAVGREFNRRLKKAFDAAGIEMPYTPLPRYLEERLQAEAAAAEPAKRVKTA